MAVWLLRMPLLPWSETQLPEPENQLPEPRKPEVASCLRLHTPQKPVGAERSVLCCQLSVQVRKHARQRHDLAQK